MKTKAILFDLDGTLLPLDQDAFVKAYVGGLVSATAKAGYPVPEMAQAIIQGTEAMVQNRGEKTNEEVLLDTLVSAFGEGIRKDAYLFDAFHAGEFQKVRQVCGFSPKAKEVIDLVKKRGFQAVLATNPLFPAKATHSRIRWAGLSPDDFSFVTTYENSRHSKPNLDYDRDILSMLGLSAKECVMVGNDVDEDMIAAELGMPVFLLTDCLLNRHSKDISAYPSGDFSALITYLSSLS